MNDRDIRPILVADIRSRCNESVVYEELPLSRGDGRADVAAVNGAICGYEIKGEGDSLRRLTKQIVDYERVFDYCAVVVTPNHLKHVRKMLPSYWGIFLVWETEAGPTIEQVRKARRNAHTDPAALARLMWRREAARALSHCGIRTPPQTLICHLWELIDANMSPRVIAREVRVALKARAGCECLVP